MINKFFSNYLKSLLIIAFLSTATNYGMESEGDQNLINFNKHIEKENDIEDFNMLAELPVEILHALLMMLPHELSSKYVKNYLKYIRKLYTKEMAEFTIELLWKKLILASENIIELEKKIVDKYQCLDLDANNDCLLKQAFEDIINPELEDLKRSERNLFLCLRSKLKNENWIELNDKIEQFDNQGFYKDMNNEDKLVHLKRAALMIKDIKSDLKNEAFYHIFTKINPSSFLGTIICLTFNVFFVFASLTDKASISTMFPFMLTMLCVQLMVLAMISNEKFSPILNNSIGTLDEKSNKLDQDISQIQAIEFKKN